MVRVLNFDLTHALPVQDTFYVGHVTCITSPFHSTGAVSHFRATDTWVGVSLWGQLCKETEEGSGNNQLVHCLFCVTAININNRKPDHSYKAQSLYLQVAHTVSLVFLIL